MILGLGFLALLVFFVVFLIFGVKLFAGGLEKMAGICVSIAMLFVVSSFYLKVQHWPGAGVLVGLAFIGLTISGIIMVIDAFKETDAKLKAIKALFGLTLLIFNATSFFVVYYSPL